MKLQGSFSIKASRQAVWDFMVDPMAIGGCAPGVGTVEVVIPNQKFQAIVSAGFGGSSATFKTEVEFTELIAPVSAKFKAHGVASSGAIDATSEMTLVDAADGMTEVKWVADVVVVGALASLAARLMDTITRRLTAEFFACMQRQINIRSAEAASAAVPDAATKPAEPAPTAPILTPTVLEPNTPLESSSVIVGSSPRVPEPGAVPPDPSPVPAGPSPAASDTKPV